MSALQCDISTPFNLCGVNVFFNPQTEFSACEERLLLIGQMTTGSATAGTAVQVFGAEDELLGPDSMASAMVKAARCQGQFSDIWVLPLADFGTQGTSEITITDAAMLTGADVVSAVINGEVYSASFTVGDTDDDIALALGALIDDPTLTVSVTANVITVTTVNGGAIAGALDVRSSYNVLNISEPSELGIAINTTQGTGLPSLGAALDMLGSSAFTFIANPYFDGASIAAFKDYLCKTWSPRIQTRAEGFTVMGGTIAEAQSASALYGSPQEHLAYFPGALEPSYEATAAFAMAAYQGLNTCNDPLTISNPLCDVVLPCLSAPEAVDRMSLNTTDTLIGDGLSIIGVNANGEANIVDFGTTYTQTAQGVEDDAFRYGNAVAQTRYISSYIENRLRATYASYSFRSDRFTPRAGQRVVALWEIEAFVQAMGFELSNRNVIEDPQAFAEQVQVGSDGNSGCVNISIQANLVTKLCCFNLFINTSL